MAQQQIPIFAVLLCVGTGVVGFKGQVPQQDVAVWYESLPRYCIHASVGRTHLLRDGSAKLWLTHADLDLAWPLSRQIAATFKWNHREEEKQLIPNPILKGGDKLFCNIV